MLAKGLKGVRILVERLAKNWLFITTMKGTTNAQHLSGNLCFGLF
jgi:hypothetical protein